MKIDIDVMKNIASSMYVPMVERRCGQVGTRILKELLNAIHKIYSFISPELCLGEIIIFKTFEDDSFPIDISNSYTISSLDQLSQNISNTIVMQVLDSGKFLVWNKANMDVLTLSDSAIVYKYKSEVEKFYFKGEYSQVPKLCVEYSSSFAIPTFNNLKEALNHYKTKMVRYASCKILAPICYDHNRLFFKNKPESIMRDSLTQFLKISLRDAEVRPEQVVDETHPVDIKITWPFSNKLALIEIKWLGKSVTAEGRFSSTHTDKRARDGAKQLADYLDANIVQSPGHLTRGYLVIIDGRRLGLNTSATLVDSKRGLYYRDRVIVFNPEYHNLRSDFEKPIRMFMEPICS